MASGYKIFWTDHALIELAETYKYLEENFSEIELKRLSVSIEITLNLISKNPKLFPTSDLHGVRKVVVKRYNTMYYREVNQIIEILSFFSNRQNPAKRRI